MTIKQFEILIARLHVEGDKMFAEHQHLQPEMISYHAWERRVIVNAAKELEKPTSDNHQVSTDGKHWQPAKQEPYYPLGIELIKCTFGFHELVQSKKYAHTKYCFRCGKRKQDKKFNY